MPFHVDVTLDHGIKRESGGIGLGRRKLWRDLEQGCRGISTPLEALFLEGGWDKMGPMAEPKGKVS